MRPLRARPGCRRLRPRDRGLRRRSEERSVSFEGKHYRLDELRAGNQQIDAAAEKAGRDPGSIRRILNVPGVIGDGPVPSRSELPVGYLAGEPLARPAGWWVELLAGEVAPQLRGSG